MKYMLMKHTPRGGPYQIASWPPNDIKAHIGFMIGFASKLGESGELVAAEGLAGPDQAKIVRAGKDGAPVIDGVFPESKEFLAGYWIVDVEGPERAYAIAAGSTPFGRTCSSVPATTRRPSIATSAPPAGRRTPPSGTIC